MISPLPLKTFPEFGAYVRFSSHLRPAIRCSRCIPNTETKQRAAATIGARFDGSLLERAFSKKARILSLEFGL
ncbi:MAG: hypothetical protein WCL14_10455 [Bacteroidota bacterium]